MWIESGGASAWMESGSTCWRQPTPDGGGVTGCADSTGPSCGRGGRTPRVTVQPGAQVWVHAVGPTVDLDRLSYDPFDIATTAADIEPVSDGSNGWAFRAPDAGAVLDAFVRGQGTEGGDASFATCIRVAGEAPLDAQPVHVTSTRDLITSRATAELRFRIDAGGGGPIPVAAGSLRCAHVMRPVVSKHLVWRCSALLASASTKSGTRVVGTVAVWSRAVSERATSRVLVLDANQAHLGSRRGVVSVSGYLMEQAAGHFRLCAAGYVSMPPSCHKGGVRVASLDAGSYRLDSYGARRFSREEVAVFGRLTRGVLTADP
jgi:hypothetical protein